ncbi:MAG: hypothetical protein NVS3B12_03390 [Acidimicrobiales bacterium]
MGDEVIGLRNDRRVGILNGDVATVTALDPDEATITVALRRAGRDGGARQVVLPPGYTERHLDHAYALTAYKGQGLTVDRTFSLGDDTLNAQVGYTTLSRGKTANDLYWVAPEPAEAVHARSDPHWALARALATSRTQVTATAMLGDVGVLAATRTLRDLEMEHMTLGAVLRRDMPADLSSELAAARRSVTDTQHQLVAAAAEHQRLGERLAEAPAWRRAERAALRSKLQIADADPDGSGWERRPDTPTQRRAWRHDARLILAVRDRTGGHDPTQTLHGQPTPAAPLPGVRRTRVAAHETGYRLSSEAAEILRPTPDRGRDLGL